MRTWCEVRNFAWHRKGVHDGGIAPLTCHKGAEVPFYKIFIGNFMVSQDRIETNLLQPFAHPEISERFSIFSGIIFEVNIVAEQKQG